MAHRFQDSQKRGAKFGHAKKDDKDSISFQKYVYISYINVKTLKEAGTMGVSGDEIRYLHNNGVDVESFYKTVCIHGSNVDEINIQDQAGDRSTIVIEKCREIKMKMIWKKYAKQ